LLRIFAIAVAVSLPVLAAHAESPSGRPRVGESYAIRREVNSSWTGASASTGSTHDVDVIVERVIAIDDAGDQLEFDFPDGTSAEERAREWKFPARVLRPRHGPFQLLNASELEGRLLRWLRAAELTREACGHWYFTWNAFQIDCDPQSVIHVVEAFEQWPEDLREGASYQQDGSQDAVTLTEQGSGSERVYVARMQADAEVVRRERARQDVVVAEIMRRPLTFDAALAARSAERISGTITTTFAMETGSNIRRRTTVTELEISGAEGQEHHTTTETLERRLISSPAT
jgi:hypothetical protein